MSLADQSQQWFPTSVQVTVLQAKNLRIKGKNGTNDAYAIMQVAKDKFSTSVAEKCVAPVWKEEATFDLPLFHHGNADRCTLHVHVMHRALVGPDKLLGQAVINLLDLEQNKARDKTEWFKLLDKSGKADKERGEVLLNIQFMKNNMTASMFDLSSQEKSRSRMGKLKDKLRGKKKEGLSDSASAVVPSVTQVMTDSEGEEEEREGGDGGATSTPKKKKNKLKSLFAPKSNLQRNVSQSMSTLGPLPERDSALGSSRSSGLNVESPEGKKKFKFLTHKRTGSSDSKSSLGSFSGFGQPKQSGTLPSSNLCINGSHVYAEEAERKPSRASSTFSLSSSGHGSMEELRKSSSPSGNSFTTSVESLRASRSHLQAEEVEEEEQSRRRRREEEEEKRMLEEEEEERSRLEEERVERERRRMQEERERIKREAEEERRRKEEEERRTLREEEEKRIRKEKEEERQRKEQERLMEEERQRKEQERLMEEERQRKEQERLMEEERQRKEQERLMEEEGQRKEQERLMEEERQRKEQERLMEEERQRKEQERLIEEEKSRVEKERMRREQERLMEEERRRAEEERVRKEQERRQEEEEKIRREQEEEERQRMEQERRREEERRRIEEEEEKIRRDEERRREEERLQEEERRRIEEEERLIREERERIWREEEEKLELQRQKEEETKRGERNKADEIEEMICVEEQIKKEEERRMLEEEERVRREKEERERIEREEEEERQRIEEERVRKEEERVEEEREMIRREEERRRIEREGERAREEQERQKEKERLRAEEEERLKREEEEERQRVEEKRLRMEEEERLRRAEREERLRKEEEERKKKEEEEDRQMKLEEERMKREEEEEEERQKKLEEEEERTRLEQERRMKVERNEFNQAEMESVAMNPFEDISSTHLLNESLFTSPFEDSSVEVGSPYDQLGHSSKVSTIKPSLTSVGFPPQTSLTPSNPFLTPDDPEDVVDSNDGSTDDLSRVWIPQGDRTDKKRRAPSPPVRKPAPTVPPRTSTPGSGGQPHHQAVSQREDCHRALDPPSTRQDKRPAPQPPTHPRKAEKTHRVEDTRVGSMAPPGSETMPSSGNEMSISPVPSLASQVFRNALQNYSLSLKGSGKGEKIKSSKSSRVELSVSSQNSDGTERLNTSESSSIVQTSHATNPFLEPTVFKHNKGPAPRPRSSTHSEGSPLKAGPQGGSAPKTDDPKVSQHEETSSMDPRINISDVPEYHTVEDPKKLDMTESILAQNAKPEDQSCGEDAGDTAQLAMAKAGSVEGMKSHETATDSHIKDVQNPPKLDVLSNEVSADGSKRVSEKKTRAPLPPASTPKTQPPKSPDPHSLFLRSDVTAPVEMTPSNRNANATISVKSAEVGVSIPSVAIASPSKQRVRLSARVDALPLSTANGTAEDLGKAGISTSLTSTSRRPHAVKPLSAQEPTPTPRTQPNQVGMAQSARARTRGAATKAPVSEPKGPYSQLTQEELISLVLRQQEELAQRSSKIQELEEYIDNLVLRVMEEQPTILMSLSIPKKGT